MVENNDANMLELRFMDVDVDELIENKYYNNFVYVDVQGFRTFHNRFMCKEFCLVDGDFIYHALVKSPYSFNKMPAYYQRQANWLINQYHRIKYDCGDVHINELKEATFSRIENKTILVKGVQKISWLKHMFRDCGNIECVNVEDLDEFDLTDRRTEPYDVCEYHNKIFGWTQGPCAMTTALMLQDLTLKNSN